MPRDRLFDGGHGLVDNQVNTQRAQFGGGPMRVAIHTVARPQPVGAHQRGVERHHQRGVGEPGMVPISLAG